MDLLTVQENVREPAPMKGHDEAFKWVTSNCIALRRDNGDMDYSLGQMVRAFEAGRATVQADPVRVEEG